MPSLLEYIGMPRLAGNSNIFYHEVVKRCKKFLHLFLYAIGNCVPLHIKRSAKEAHLAKLCNKMKKDKNRTERMSKYGAAIIKECDGYV